MNEQVEQMIQAVVEGYDPGKVIDELKIPFIKPRDKKKSPKTKLNWKKAAKWSMLM